MSNNPFPGLRPFEQKETHLFFGRDGQSNELLRRLHDSRFLALVGVSGSGKSSLIRAGLLPALYGGLMSSVESDWRIAVFRPGNNPIGNMARALITQAGLGGDSGFEDIEAAIAETTLRRGNLGLLELLRQAKTKMREDGRPFLGPNENVLLVVDQFEEIFRIIEQYDELVRVKQLSEGRSDLAGTSVADLLDYHPREEASAFVKLLLESTQKNAEKKYDENVYVIVTMRSDYLGETAQFWGMPERINEGQYLIPRMNRDERRKAIVGPVAVAGGSIAEPLVNQLLNDAGENPGHLPILQHALMRMWELAERAPKNGGLNLKRYDEIGKLSGALSQHANEAYDELSTAHQELTAKVFKCLTEKGLANREIRRPMTLVDICAVVGAKEQDVRTVVDCFRQEGRWFLMPAPTRDKDGNKKELQPETLIDISHESLISGWDRLSKWVNEEAESARTYKRLADTAILKERGEEDFYRGPALQLALKWREENGPNAVWARRYHPEFTKAIAFLDESLDDTQKREKAEKDRVAKELRRRRRYNIVLSILMIFTLAAACFAFFAQRRSLEASAIQEAALSRANFEAERGAAAQARALEAEKLTKQADDERQKAATAANNLAESLQKEQDAVKAAKTARETAIIERDKATLLQNENLEQSIVNGYFKSALDNIAARNTYAAIVDLKEALSYYQAKKDRVNTISTTVSIADIYGSSRAFDFDALAIQNYDDAIRLIGSSNNRLLATTLMKAGGVWKDSLVEERALKAAAYYESAATLFRELGPPSESARGWMEAGRILLRFSNAERLLRASEDFEKAVSSRPDAERWERNAEIGEIYKQLAAEKTDSDSRVADRLRRDGARFFGNAVTDFQNRGLFKDAARMEVKRGEILAGSRSAGLVEAAAEAFIRASDFHSSRADKETQASVLLAGAELLEKNGTEAAQREAAKLRARAALVGKEPPQEAATLTQYQEAVSNNAETIGVVLNAEPRLPR